ncbi:hypothetical protein BH11PLA2_BH11PLA2_22270 [soil metagenome]
MTHVASSRRGFPSDSKLINFAKSKVKRAAGNVGTRFLTLAAMLMTGILGVAPKAYAQQSWGGPGSTTTINDIFTPSNWSNGVVPTSVQEAQFRGLGSLTPDVTTNWNTRYVGFYDTIPLAGYTFSGPGVISIPSNGNLDTNNASGGDITFNNGGFDFSRASGIYASSGNNGTSNIIFGSGAALRMGLAGSSGNPFINALGGNVTINSANGVDFSGNSVTRNLALSVNAGKVITLTNGFKYANGSTQRLGNVVVSGTGTVVLGANPITPGTTGSSSLWTGSVTFVNNFIEITNNDSLGTPGSENSQYTEPGGSSSIGALVLTNNITVGEYIYLGGRNSINNNNAQIINKSGNNKLTGNIGSDWGAQLSADATASANDTNYRIQSNGGSLELSGNLLAQAAGYYGPNAHTGFTTSATLTLNLGAVTGASGLISGTITELDSNWKWDIVKDGLGTWTFSGANTYTGTTIIKAGTLALSGSGSIANTPSIDVRSGATFSTAGLNSGGLTLTDTQTLKGAGTVIGGITGVSGTIIAPGDSGAGTLTINGPLALSGSTLQFQLTNSPASGNDKIFSNNVLSGSGTIAVTMLNGVLGSGSYRLIDYTGPAVAPGAFVLSGVTLSPRQTSATISSVANQLNLDVIGGPATLTWLGNNGSNWDVGATGTVNWTGAPGPAFDNHFYDGDSVIFDNTGTTVTPVVSGTVNPGAVTFSNGLSQNYSLSGGTINAGNMTIAGAGTVALENASTIVSNIFNVTGSGDFTVANGNFSVGTSFTMNGTGKVTFANSLALLSLPASIAVNSGTLVIDRTDDFSVANVITGTGTFQKSNTNTITSTANNSGFTGFINVLAGTLKVGNANALGAASTTITSGATLDLNGTFLNAIPNANVTVSGDGVSGGLGVLYNSSATSDSSIPRVTLNGTATFGSGAAHGWSIGDGTASSSFTGNNNDLTVFSVRENDIFLTGDMGIKNLTIGGGGPLYIAGGTTLGPAASGTITLLDSGRLAFYGAGSTNGTVISTGVIDKPIVVDNTTNGGELEIYVGNKAIASPIRLDGKLSVEVIARSTGTWTATLTGPITGPINGIDIGGDLLLHANSNSTSRFGAVVLTNDNNTYKGKTIIGGGGGLSGTLPANDRITSVYIGNGGATGSIGTGDIIINPAGNTLRTTLFLNRTGTYALVNNIALNGNSGVATIYQIAAGDTTLSGTISGLGSVNVYAGNLTLSGTGNTQDFTQVFSGQLIAASDSATGNPLTGYIEIWGPIPVAVVYIGDDTAALVLRNGITIGKPEIYVVPHTTNTAPHIIGETGSNTLNGTLLLDVSPTATIKDVTLQANANAGLTLTGEIQGNVAGTVELNLRGAGTGTLTGPITQTVNGNLWNLNKFDSGTWTLSGTSSYTGTTTINAGTLALGASGTINSSPTILIQSGATLDVTGVSGGYSLAAAQTLKGTGTVTGQLNVGNTAIIVPGSGTSITGSGNSATVGTITTGSLNLTGGGVLKFDLDNSVTGSNDKIAVQGDLILSGNTTIAVTPFSTSGTLGSGNYHLFTYTGTLNNFDAVNSFTLTGVTSTPRQIISFASTATEVNLVVLGNPATLTWTGAGGSLWVTDPGDQSTPVNWAGAADGHFYSGDSVIFSSGGTPAVNVSSAVAPNTITFTSGAQAYTFTGTGSISSGSDLSFASANNATFSNADLSVGGNLIATGAGALTISTPGTVSITNNLNVSSAGNVTLDNNVVSLAIGGSLLVSGTGTVTANINGAFGITGNVMVSSSLPVNLSSASFLTIGGNYSSTGSGIVTFGGTSDLTVTGTFTQGGTGSTVFANSGNLFLPASLAVTAGKLVFIRPSTGTISNTFTGGGTVRNESPANVVTTFSGSLNGFAGTIEAANDVDGVMVLSGSNANFNGAMTVISGTLQTKSSTALGLGGSLANGVIVNSGATLDVGTNGNTTVFNGTETVAISGNGVNGIGALTVAQGASGIASTAHINSIILNANSKISAIGSGTSTAGRSLFYIDGTNASIVGNAGVLYDLDVVVSYNGGPGGTSANGTEMDWLGVGVVGVKNLNLSGGAELFIGGNTSFSTVSGTLNLGDGGRLGLYAPRAGFDTDLTGIILKPIVSVTGFSNEIDCYDGSKTIDSPIQVDGNLDLTVSTFINNSRNVLTMTGKISGSTGTLAFHLFANGTVSRVGTVELTNSANDFSGLITIGGGGGLTQAPADNDRITLSVGNGGTTGSLGNGTGTVTVNDKATLQFNRNAAFTVSNVIDGVGSITSVAPNGVVTLTADNSYTGTTTITAGTVSVTGSLASLSVQVNGGDGSGGTLTGTGTINGPVGVTGGSGAVPIPGSIRGGVSIGTLTLTQPLAFSAGGRLIVQIGSGNAVPAAMNSGLSTDIANLPNSQTRNSFIHILNAPSNSNLDSGMLVQVDGTAATFVTGSQYSFLVMDGTGLQSFNINGVSNPGQFSFIGVNVNPASVSLQAGMDGNVYLNFTAGAVPEPTALLGLLGLGLLIRRRR